MKEVLSKTPVLQALTEANKYIACLGKSNGLFVPSEGDTFVPREAVTDRGHIMVRTNI